MDVSQSGPAIKQEEIEVLTFHVAGAGYRPPSVIEAVRTGDEIILEAEPTNEFDPMAIKVISHKQNELIGYVPKKNTWILHLVRQLGISLRVNILVNNSARPMDMFLVRVTAYGSRDAVFKAKS